MPFEVANFLFLVLAAQAIPAFQADCENMQTCLATFKTFTVLCNYENSEFGASDCSQLELHINGLESSMEKICAATADTTNIRRRGFNQVWLPVVPISLGSFDVGISTIQYIYLPFSLPLSSREILIYIWITVLPCSWGYSKCSPYSPIAVHTLQQSDYYRISQ